MFQLIVEPLQVYQILILLLTIYDFLDLIEFSTTQIIYIYKEILYKSQFKN